MSHRSRLLLFVALIGWIFYSIQLLWWPDAIDYYYTFHKMTDTWWKGQAVYDPPFYGFFNAPWLILLLTPLQWMTYKGGQAALNTFSFCVILLGWRWFSKPNSEFARPVSLAICLFNLHLFDLLLRGQVDGFVLFGALIMSTALAQNNPYLLSIGWFFGAIRPTSILLIWPYTIWVAFRKGYWKKAFIIPIFVVILSLIIFDPLWMWRWYDMIRFKAPPLPGVWLISWWRVAETLNISSIFAYIIVGVIFCITIWVMVRYNPKLKTAFAFLALASLLVTPYSLSYHYSLLMVMFIPILVDWKLWLSVPLFTLTLTPALRAVWGVEYAWLDIFFILFAWILLILYIRVIHQDNPISSTVVSESISPINL